MLIAPISHLEAIEIGDANRLLELWGHKMGACRRPNADLWAHALYAHGNPIAVTVTAALVNKTCAGLTRNQAVELARLCADRPNINRVMLRLWRELVFPALSAQRGWTWAVSYQDERLHSGNTYRFDGWVKLREHSRSGIDQRSGRKGRTKTIWGWRLPDAPIIRRNPNA